MPATKNSAFVPSCRAIVTDSTDLCGFIAKTCILLFFSFSASKITDSLIVTSASETKKIKPNPKGIFV
jgi:hypothetical protein